MKDFNFQLFGVLRVSPVRCDGSPSWYLTFYLNLSGRGVKCYLNSESDELIESLAKLQLHSLRKMTRNNK